MNESTARQGWLYVSSLVISALWILVCLATVKFFTENRLAPKNFGLAGELSQSNLDLLLIGSSHTRKSYDMRLLEKSTGLTTSYQISYDGTDLSMISQMLDYLLTTPTPCPHYIVIEAYSAFLARKPDLQDPRYFFDAPPALKTTIVRSYLSMRRSPTAFLDILDLIVNRGNDEIVAYPLYAWAVRSDSYKGGRAEFVFPGVQGGEFRKFKAEVTGDIPDPVQLAALYHILDTADSHNIEIIFIDPPMPQPVSSNSDIQALKKDFAEILRVRHIPFIDGDHGFPIDDPSLFSDSNHLSSKGREEFTPRVSRELSAWMASEPGPRH